MGFFRHSEGSTGHPVGGFRGRLVKYWLSYRLSGESEKAKADQMRRWYHGPLFFVAVLLATLLQSATPLSAQDEPASPAVSDETKTAAEVADPPLLNRWDRLIYVPFRELSRVFNRQDASVVLPYAEYMEMLRSALERAQSRPSEVDALIRSADWSAVVEGDVVRLTLTLDIRVLQESDDWVSLPLHLGNAAVGNVEASAGRVLLQAVGEEQYRLLISGTTETIVSLELLAGVTTSPESRSFEILCPSSGITNLQVTIPEKDQDVRIAPMQVLRAVPADQASEGTTVVRAGLGATERFEVSWFPRAGSRPEMDLLTSVSSETDVRLESGLAQYRTTLHYEILRGQLEEVRLQVAPDARVIDVSSTGGRIRSWKLNAVGDSHQLLIVELLSSANSALHLEVQSERTFEGDVIQLLGRDQQGVVQGVHAEGVLRENGKLRITTDPALTALVTEQSGVRQTGAEESQGKGGAAGAVWEHRGVRSQLAVRVTPVEPRLTVEHSAQYTFRDDELAVRSVLDYTVERAGVFQLALQVSESLTVDSVSADGMSEFSVDKGTGRVVLSLTQQRLGKIQVTILAHQDFDSTVANDDLELPAVTPEGVERETGTVLVFAPEFLDVITADDRMVGLVPLREGSFAEMSGYRRVGVWSFTRRPISLSMRTVPRPAQISGFVATTVQVDPEVLRISSIVSSDIHNAGIDRLRVAVPEAVAEDVRFRVVSGGNGILQRERLADAEDGWVTWVLTLQRETTGVVDLSVEWDQPLTSGADDEVTEADAAAESLREAELQPPRLLSPWEENTDGRRRVVMTPPSGELRVLRHESLSLQMLSMNEQMEQIDVRELQRLQQDGYLAWRYFSQPAAATIGIRRHDVHEVVETVVSRVAIEVVTESQLLASWRVRLRLTSSERQRLRVDLPTGSDFQAPLLNGSRTTIEKADDVTPAEGRDAYYINISRDESSDTEFGLTLQYRSAIGTESRRPFAEWSGSRQALILPQIGRDDGSTVVQQVRVAVWAPEDVRFTGSPAGWIREHDGRNWFDHMLEPPSDDRTAAELSDWVKDGLSADFPVQGNVVVFSRTGLSAAMVVLTWWKQYTLLALISGSIGLIGLVLRRTSWENRITMLLIATLSLAIASVQQGSAVPDLIPLAMPGLGAAGIIWCLGLLSSLSVRRENEVALAGVGLTAQVISTDPASDSEAAAADDPGSDMEATDEEAAE